MADRHSLIVRLGAAILAATDPATQAVLDDALKAILEDTSVIAAAERRKEKDRQRKRPTASTESVESKERAESVESAEVSPPPAGKERVVICPPPVTASPSDGATPRHPRAKRPSAPWMGLMAKAWTLGTLPPGSATLLQPVVAEVGPEETASRLARYCQQADAEYASVRQFVSKHARYAEQVATQPAPSAPRQLRATEMLL